MAGLNVSCIGHRRSHRSRLADDTREILPLNEAQVRQECQIVKQKGLTDVAVVGVFSPLDVSGRQEARVKQIVLEEIPGADVVLSRESKCPRPPHCQTSASDRATA
jgi:N-methylhydantoinase A/oxoprolinase/acetone carboxylase beta subunit